VCGEAGLHELVAVVAFQLLVLGVLVAVLHFFLLGRELLGGVRGVGGETGLGKGHGAKGQESDQGFFHGKLLMEGKKEGQCPHPADVGGNMTGL